MNREKKKGNWEHWIWLKTNESLQGHQVLKQLTSLCRPKSNAGIELELLKRVVAVDARAVLLDGQCIKGSHRVQSMKERHKKYESNALKIKPHEKKPCIEVQSLTKWKLGKDQWRSSYGKPPAAKIGYFFWKCYNNGKYLMILWHIFV